MDATLGREKKVRSPYVQDKEYFCTADALSQQISQQICYSDGRTCGLVTGCFHCGELQDQNRSYPSIRQ